MSRLKLTYFGPIMQRASSIEKFIKFIKRQWKERQKDEKMDRLNCCGVR